jgi:hypothetical protein
VILREPQNFESKTLGGTETQADTGKCSEYVCLNLYFHSQIGPVCLKGVEAYVVKDMEANLLVSKHTQCAWKLHTIHEDDSSYWRVRDSPHHIPTILAPTPVELFSAQWVLECEIPCSDKPTSCKKPTSEGRKEWNAVAKYDLTIQPESIASVTAISRGAPSQDTMYLEVIPLKHGPDSFISALQGILNLNNSCCFQIKIANTTKCNILIHAGELLGCLTRAKDTLQAANDLSELKRDDFCDQATQLATLTPNTLGTTFPQGDLISEVVQEGEDVEHLGWAPKPWIQS